MLLVSRVCKEHKLIAQVELYAGLRHSTLNAILRDPQSRISRADFDGLPDAIFLIVQYLHEKAGQLSSRYPGRSKRLEATADEITRLFNEAYVIPFDKARLDGPTHLIRPKSESPRHVD